LGQKQPAIKISFWSISQGNERNKATEDYNNQQNKIVPSLADRYNTFNSSRTQKVKQLTTGVLVQKASSLQQHGGAYKSTRLYNSWTATALDILREPGAAVIHRVQQLCKHSGGLDTFDSMHYLPDKFTK
jgi:hypothetical protein